MQHAIKIGQTVIPVERDWSLCLTAAGEFAKPSLLPRSLERIKARVPGSAAGALLEAGLGDQVATLDDHDIWYEHDREASLGEGWLLLSGLATLAEIWIGDELVLASSNMFLDHTIDLANRAGEPLSICFRSLGAHLGRPIKRARWRPRMAIPSQLNSVRTTLIGHMPGWCPNIPATGPWRGIEIVRHTAPFAVQCCRLTSTCEGNDGRLNIDVEFDSALDVPPELSCHGKSVSLTRTEGDRYEGTLQLRSVEKWWPHTHGEPVLYPVELIVQGTRHALPSIGFRTIEIDRGENGEGFTLICNGVRVFCRGACWTPASLTNLSGALHTVLDRLRLAKAAGMNMIRVGGTMVYESKAFFEACNQLGILVWHDFMFANFDYPAADPEFAGQITSEARQFLSRIEASPSLAALCGGSEVYQQAAMLGLAERQWLNPIFESLLPEMCRDLRPDVPYIVNSPSGGTLPFVVNAGVSHYYGVGAYKRPLEDARRANIRFASECLAFANVSDDTSHWNEGVPRDVGADWDFADVTDFYIGLLFRIDVEGLKASDLDRYLELARASNAHVMQQSFAEWRRSGSTNAGALVWFLADLQPGSGWGVIDHSGSPKSVWHAMRQSLQPQQVLLIDEGVNGLMTHVINETPVPRSYRLDLACYGDGESPVVRTSRTIEIEPHSQSALAATDLIGAFFDMTYAYRFGPPAHQTVIATITEPATETLVSEFSYFPSGPGGERSDLGMTATVERDGDAWSLSVWTKSFARFVQIDDDHFLPSENWFHLPPGRTKRVEMRRRASTADGPSGRIRALNGHAIAYGGAQA